MQKQAQLHTYTPEQVAEIYQVSMPTIYEMIKDGRLKAKKLGDRIYRIPARELAWITYGYDEDILTMQQEDNKALTPHNVRDLKKIRKKLNEKRGARYSK